jgi:SEC-C motif domain protein
MRSRYAAYVLGSIDYLKDTWHATTRPKDLSPDPGVTWLALTIEKASHKDDVGYVAFTAKFRENGRIATLKETSRFIREGGRWFYVDGVIAP